MAINNNDNGLYTNIEAALTQAHITMSNVPSLDDNGDVTYGDVYFPLLPNFIGVTSGARVVSFDHPTKPTFQPSYGTDTDPLTDGMRKIVEVISKETLNYIVANAEVAAKARYDQLEQDYNDLFQATQTVVGLVTAAYASNTAAVQLDITGNTKPYVTYFDMLAFLTPLIGAGGPTFPNTRQTATTEELINNNELINEIPVDIK